MSTVFPARCLAIATSVLSPGINPDDELLVELLKCQGVVATPFIWNDPTVDWAAFDAILIRSVWDYFKHYQEFLGWLTQLEQLEVPTINPTRLLRWNSDKRYLLQLPPLGVAIIPTQVARAQELPGTLASMRGLDVVVKPTVSGTAWHTVRGVAGSDALNQALAALPVHLDYLVQPFMPEIAQEGEWSLLFFGDAYSHAVCKRPAPNDYRVQKEFGGSVVTITPDSDILAAAEQALAAVSALGYGGGSYARIDGVCSDGRFRIMEVEMIEPFLFFSGNAAASQRFAEVISLRLPVRRR